MEEVKNVIKVKGIGSLCIILEKSVNVRVQKTGIATGRHAPRTRNAFNPRSFPSTTDGPAGYSSPSSKMMILDTHPGLGYSRRKAFQRDRLILTQWYFIRSKGFIWQLPR